MLCDLTLNAWVAVEERHRGQSTIADLFKSASGTTAETHDHILLDSCGSYCCFSLRMCPLEKRDGRENDRQRRLLFNDQRTAFSFERLVNEEDQLIPCAP